MKKPTTGVRRSITPIVVETIGKPTQLNSLVRLLLKMHQQQQQQQPASHNQEDGDAKPLN